MELVNKVKENKLTYLCEDALNELINEIAKCNKLEGIFIETGCALGGSGICIAGTKLPEKKLYIYDVFGMIPQPGDKDNKDVHERYEEIVSGLSKGIDGDEYYGYQKNLYEVVQRNFKKVLGYTDLKKENVFLIKGLFEDTLLIEDKVACAHIDCDWYDSVMVCLERIVPKLVSGGSLIIDDYYAWSGCKDAVDDYFKDKMNGFEFVKKNRLHIIKK